MPGNRKPTKKYNPHRRAHQYKEFERKRLNELQNAQMAKTLREFGAFTVSERVKLKLPPHESFVAMRNGQGTHNDWLTLLVRVQTGLEIAKTLHYDKEVLQDFEAGVVFTMAVRHRAYQFHPPVWTITVDEAQQISLCLNATDELQDVTENEKRLDILWESLKRVDERTKQFV